MRSPTVRGVKAENIICFAFGILLISLGIYGVYYLFAVELPSKLFTRLPFAAMAAIVLGAVLIWWTYPIFFPLPKSSSSQSGVCPFCGALVDEYAEVCEKCKRQLED